MGVRQAQREKRRWEIIEAALDLFISKGYAGTKISDIAGRVSMSVGLLFHYFESKAKLYEELIRIGLQGPASVMGFDDSDPLRFFGEIASYIMSALRDNSFTAKMFVLMIQVRFDASVPESVKEHLNDNSLLEKSIAIISAGQSSGQVRDGDPVALAILFWQSISGIALYAAISPDSPLPEPEWIIDCMRSADR